MDFLVAVVGLVLAFVVTCLGLGLLIDWLCAALIPGELLLGLGFCAATVTTLAAFTDHLHGTATLVLLLVMTVAGLILGRRRWLALRTRAGLSGVAVWTALAGLATYLLFIAPELFSGDWTWVGYDFVNDTTVHFLLVDHLQHFGTALGNVAPSSGREIVRTYLASGYPLGTHAHLATLGELLGTRVEVLYQAYISSLAATAAVTLAWLARRVGMGPRAAAAIGLCSASANLTYQYALQGSIKELGVITALALCAALASELIRSPRALRLTPALAVALASVLAVYNVAGAPYIGALMLLVAALCALTGPGRGWRGLRAPVLAGAGALVLAIPALSTIVTLFRTAQATFTGPQGGITQLGQLARPLPVTQASGVWLSGDYRLPILQEPAGTLTVLATAVVLAGLALALARLIGARREWTLALVVAPVLTVLAILGPGVSPYAAAKLLAIAGSFVVWGAAIGLLWLAVLVREGWAPRTKGRAGRRVLGRRLSFVPVLAAVAVALMILVSDVLAYHHDQVAPTARMRALQQVADHLPRRGLVLFTEYEEFAKYFGRSVQVNAQSEAFTPLQVRLRNAANPFGQSFDLDEDQLDYVERFPYIVTRTGPGTSRPPANYAPVFANRFYQAFRREATPVVARHLPLQGVYSATAVAPCGALARLAASARPGEQLLAAVHPGVASFDTAHAVDRSASFVPSPSPDAVLPSQPGQARGTVALSAAGIYEAWLQGSFPRPIVVSVDQREVGQVGGANTPRQWLLAGRVALSAGSHSVVVHRPGGGPGPGDGADEAIGPLVLESPGGDQLQPVSVSRWRALCGRVLDWVELVRR